MASWLEQGLSARPVETALLTVRKKFKSTFGVRVPRYKGKA